MSEALGVDAVGYPSQFNDLRGARSLIGLALRLLDEGLPDSNGYLAVCHRKSNSGLVVLNGSEFEAAEVPHGTEGIAWPRS